MSLSSLAKWSIIISIALLFNKTVAVFGLKLDVVFLILGTILLFLALIRKEVDVEWKRIIPYAIAIAILLLTTVIGSLTSYHLFGSIPLSQIKTEYHILAGCFLLFFDIIILGMHDKKFLARTVYAFLLSVVVIITPYIPIDILQHIIGAKQHRFFGFIGDANSYPTFMMLPIVLVFYFLSKEIVKKESAIKLILLYILFSLLVVLTWWSGSRSGWLGVIVEIFLFIILAARTQTKKFLYILGMSFVFISSIVVGYFLLPANATSDIRARLGYITTPEQQAAISSPESLGGQIINVSGQKNPTTIVSNGDNSVKTIPIIDDISYNQDRIHIWEQGFHFFAQNPFGYGLVYYNIVDIVSAGHHVTAHSFIVETLLIGGIPLFASVLYLIIDVTYAFFINKKNSRIIDLETVVFVGMVGFLVCSLFLSSLLMRWFWAELGILIAWQMNEGYRAIDFSFRKKVNLDNHTHTLEE